MKPCVDFLYYAQDVNKNILNYTCGVADITDAGIGGIFVCVGSFANKDANILFFSQSLLFVELLEELVPEEDT